jgi:hypothetical protein
VVVMQKIMQEYLPLAENTCPSSDTSLPSLVSVVLVLSKETMFVSRAVDCGSEDAPLRRPGAEAGATGATVLVEVMFWFATAAAFRLREAVFVVGVVEKVDVPGIGVSLFRAFHPPLVLLTARFPADGAGDCRESSAPELSEEASTGEMPCSNFAPLLFTA